MKTIMIDTDERRWQAVCERDASADGQFCLCRADHRRLLPPLLPLAPRAAGKCSLLS